MQKSTPQHTQNKLLKKVACSVLSIGLLCTSLDLSTIINESLTK